MSILSAESLSFSYAPESGTHPVIGDFSLEVSRGELLSVIGPSGCGKSTLLRLFSGFLKPDNGKILRNGQGVNGPSREMQMIFQDFNQLLPWLTVEQNVLFSRHRTLLPLGKRLPSSAGEEELHEILALTGLEKHSRYLPHQLSGGLKQRTALARALYARPEVLFMDEPFGSLDAPARKELQELLLRLWDREKLTVLFVTHDISEALILADRLVVFEKAAGVFHSVDNSLPRPRDRASVEFAAEKMKLYSMIDSF